MVVYVGFLLISFTVAQGEPPHNVGVFMSGGGYVSGGLPQHPGYYLEMVEIASENSEQVRRA